MPSCLDPVAADYSSVLVRAVDKILSTDKPVHDVDRRGQRGAQAGGYTFTYHQVAGADYTQVG